MPYIACESLCILRRVFSRLASYKGIESAEFQIFPCGFAGQLKSSCSM
jgi:hypothetical protein